MLGIVLLHDYNLSQVLKMGGVGVINQVFKDNLGLFSYSC